MTGIELVGSVTAVLMSGASQDVGLSRRPCNMLHLSVSVPKYIALVEDGTFWETSRFLWRSPLADPLP